MTNDTGCRITIVFVNMPFSSSWQNYECNEPLTPRLLYQCLHQLRPKTRMFVFGLIVWAILWLDDGFSHPIAFRVWTSTCGLFCGKWYSLIHITAYYLQICETRTEKTEQRRVERTFYDRNSCIICILHAKQLEKRGSMNETTAATAAPKK